MAASIPFRQNLRKPSRQMTDPRNEIRPQVDHYIGIDVGTGSARACIMNDQGDIVGLASENIGLWQPQTGYYVHLSQIESRKTSNNLRNNPQQTYGDASALQYAELWISTALIETLSAVLGSTLHARFPSSQKTRTSRSA